MVSISLAVRRSLVLAAALAAGHAAGQNLLVNAEFNTNLSGWSADTGPGVYWVWDNANGFPTQGAVFGLNARTTASIIEFRQCVPVSTTTPAYTLRGTMRVASSQGTAGFAAMQWNYFPTAGCTGTTPFAPRFVNSQGDTAGEWRGVSDGGGVAPPFGAVSALIRLIVLKNQAGGAFAAEFDHLYFGPARRVKGDFDGDGQADLLLRHAGSPWNDLQIWLMNGVTRQGSAAWPLKILQPPAADWQLVGVDDWNGDKDQDLLFAHPVTGAAQILVATGNYSNAGHVYLPNTPGPGWTVDATADFDWNSWPDLLWRNTTTGELLVWTMGADFQQVGTLLPNPGSAPDANWRVVGARDFNGDNRIDFLWYNAVSGKIVFWFLDSGLNRLTGQFANPDSAGDNNWKVVATGDYGVGAGGVANSHDIVWRNDVSGKLVVWYMDKAGNRTAGVFTAPDSPQPDPLNWSVVGPR